MKILFYGDSVTDAGRMPDADEIRNTTLGTGYVMLTASRLWLRDPTAYEILNRGVSGNRSTDLYARVDKAVWANRPDLLSILAGVNDVLHGIRKPVNGVPLARFDRVYRMMLEETMEALPDTKIVLCEPFCLHGSMTNSVFAQISHVREYAKAVEKMAQDYGLYWLPLQDRLDEAAAKYGAETILRDGIHPLIPGAAILADAWTELFTNTIEPDMKGGKK